MKKNQFMTLAVIAAALTTTLSSCQAIADIFKAGMWVGIIIVVVIVALILWIVGKAGK
jgi:hypothetical protein